MNLSLSLSISIPTHVIPALAALGQLTSYSFEIVALLPFLRTRITQAGKASVACKYDNISLLELNSSGDRAQDLWYLVSSDRIRVEWDIIYCFAPYTIPIAALYLWIISSDASQWELYFLLVFSIETHFFLSGSQISSFGFLKGMNYNKPYELTCQPNISKIACNFETIFYILRCVCLNIYNFFVNFKLYSFEWYVFF